MRGRTDKSGDGKIEIHIRKEEVIEEASHGGSWKVAYADFITAMMAFFLLMWLISATTDDQRKGLADYFSPNSVLSQKTSGVGLPFAGRTPFSDGALVSDRGAEQVTLGERPAVDQVENDDGSDVIAQPRPHRDDARNDGPDQLGNRSGGAQPRPGTPPAALAIHDPVTAARQAAASAGPAAKPAAHAATPRPASEAELRRELERREKQAFEQAAQEIRDAVRGDPALSDLAGQLAVDMTPEGLRIQILDAEHRSMFALGSAVPNEQARLLLQKVAPVLARLTENISIAGHTDAVPFSGPDRTNWELSADRANATRRLLVEDGLQESRVRSVTGNADRDPLVPSDPLAAANRRIAIVVLRSVRPPIAQAPSPAAVVAPASTPSPP